MRPFSVAVLAVLVCAPVAHGEDKSSSRDVALKKLAEDFAKSMTIEKDHKKALSYVNLPFVKIEYHPKEEIKAFLITDSVELKKRIADQLELRGDEKEALTNKVYTVEEFARGLNDKIFNVAEKVLTKNDRVVSVEVSTGGFSMEVIVLTSWIKDKPKVVGCGYFYAR